MQQDEDLKQPQRPGGIVGLRDTILVIPKVLKMGPIAYLHGTHIWVGPGGG